MNELQIFKNEEFGEVRTVTIDNEPWFVGKDVAMALGYQNASKACIRVRIVWNGKAWLSYCWGLDFWYCGGRRHCRSGKSRSNDREADWYIYRIKKGMK